MIHDNGHGIGLYGLSTALAKKDSRVNAKTTAHLLTVMERVDPEGFDRQVRAILAEVA